MTIEFSCQHCGKALSTSDDKAGRKAKCPGCGEAVLVPSPSVETTNDGTDWTAISADVPDVTCPMCGAANPGRAKACESCGEPLRKTRKLGGVQAIAFEDVLSSTWSRYKECFGLAVGGNLIAGIIIVAGAIPLIGVAIAIAIMVDQQQEPPTGLVIAFFPALLVAMAVALFMAPGYVRFFIGLARGDTIGLGELFSGGRYIIRYLLWGFVYGLALALGFVMLIVPGIALLARFWPYSYVICDDPTGEQACIRRSLELTQFNWAASLGLFALHLGVSFALAILSIIPCVGLLLNLAGLFIQPFWQLMFATAYIKMSGQETID